MKKNVSIKQTLITLSVFPAMFIGVALMIISARSSWESMTNEMKNSLSIAADSLYNTYSLVAPGDFVEKDGVLMKGDRVIEGDYVIVDALKASYGLEITLFYGEERILTTIKDSQGQRMTGTTADPLASYWVLEQGREYFSPKVLVVDEAYFGYYIPVYNRDKSIVGMAFAGKKRDEVVNLIWTNVLHSLLICVIVIVATLLLCVGASQRIIKALYDIMDYLGHLAQSDFSTKMPLSVLKRKDEIGDMGNYAEKVSVALKEMIMTDPLTGLYNRRASKNHLDKWIEKCQKQNKNLITVVMADIDYFKKINDTYGHDCGDMVLVKVSELFKRHMGENGVVARWGGEEFLLVFEEKQESAIMKLKQMSKEINAYEFEHEGARFSITCTFGINTEIVGNSFDHIIDQADDYLYQGKTQGRNRMVISDGTVITGEEIEASMSHLD